MICYVNPVTAIVVTTRYTSVTLQSSESSVIPCWARIHQDESGLAIAWIMTPPPPPQLHVRVTAEPAMPVLNKTRMTMKMVISMDRE